MVRTQIIRRDREAGGGHPGFIKSTAQEIEQDSKDYRSAVAVKKGNKTWTSHEGLKKDLDL